MVIIARFFGLLSVFKVQMGFIWVSTPSEIRQESKNLESQIFSSYFGGLGELHVLGRFSHILWKTEPELPFGRPILCIHLFWP